MSNNSIIYQVSRLLSKHQISFDKEELAFQIKSHPSYPSLHSITGVLDHFQIDNIALDVPKQSEVLEQLPEVFLAQMTTDDGEDFGVVEKGKQRIKVHFTSAEKQQYTPEVFLSKFTGILVAIENNQEEVTAKNRGRLSPIFLGLALVLLFVSSWIITPQFSAIAYALMSFVGLWISTLILQQEFGIYSQIGNAFCAPSKESQDCKAVLDSKGGTLFKSFKISDLSIIYFSVLTLASVLVLWKQMDLNLLLGLSLLAVPAVVFSIVYQRFVVKKWCPLCLMLGGVLLLQAAIGSLHWNLMGAELLSSASLFPLLFFMTLTTGIWLGLRPIIKGHEQLKEDKIAYFKFKRSFKLFSLALGASSPYPVQLSEISELEFGRDRAPVHITLITNPFCGHCKEVHELMTQLLQRFPEQVRFTVRFNTDASNADTEVVKICSRILEIYHADGNATALEAMHDIYGGLGALDWLDKWGDCIHPKNYVETLQVSYQWCRQHQINFTPEILVNGFSFPREYQRGDLKYFIEDLSDQAETLTSAHPISAPAT